MFSGLALVPVATQTRVGLVERHRGENESKASGLTLGRRSSSTAADPTVSVLRSRRLRPAVEPLADLVELPLGIVMGAEVGDRQALGMPVADQIDRVVPGLDVDVRRWRRRKRRQAWLDPHTADIADEGGALVQVARRGAGRGRAYRPPRTCRRRSSASLRRAGRAADPPGQARTPPRSRACCPHRRAARRWPTAASGRSCAALRARARRPRARGTVASASRSRPHGRSGCASAGSPAAASRRAPPGHAPARASARDRSEPGRPASSRSNDAAPGGACQWLAFSSSKPETGASP